MIRIERPIFFQRDINGRKKIYNEKPPELCVESGRIPRVSRLMALAIQYAQLLSNGEVEDQSTIARLARVTQPRMTQIMNLLHLAPDIQEAILFLPRTLKGDDPIHEKLLRPMTAEVGWETQREMWREILDPHVGNQEP